MRSSAVVKCQSAFVCLALRSFCHTATSQVRVSLSGVPKVAQLAVQPLGRQLRIGRHTLQKVGIKRRHLASARWPGTIGRRFKTTLDVAPDRLEHVPLDLIRRKSFPDAVLI